MLRNVQRNKQQIRHRQLEWWSVAKGCAAANISTACCAGACGGGISYTKANIKNFQSRVMGKLLGQRVAGSKKRWFPDTAANTNEKNAALFSGKNVVKGGGSGGGVGGKNTTRRMIVLNKLFMQHITDLLATGEASEAIVGRGLQVTRVQISPDFTSINVYWLGKGELMEDAALETELRRCSGVLRHELSQLMLMGEVPRITFAKEKKFTNINEVEAILRNIDFAAADEAEQPTDGTDGRTDGEPQQRTQYNLVANMLQNEFCGKSSLNAVKAHIQVGAEKQDEQFPEMRHDVLGLDHQQIMFKLLAKMRLSRQAWEEHTQRMAVAQANGDNKQAPKPAETLEQVQQRLSEAAEKAERFERFLALRRDRKNTPERKRHDRAADWTNIANAAAEQTALDAAALTATQRRLLEAEDYLDEEQESDKRKLK